MICPNCQGSGRFFVNRNIWVTCMRCSGFGVTKIDMPLVIQMHRIPKGIAKMIEKVNKLIEEKSINDCI